MNVTERGIRESQRRWHEAPKADVIDFFDARERLRQKRAVRCLRRPRHPEPTPPRAA